MNNTYDESLSIIDLDIQQVQIIKVPYNSKPHIVPFEWLIFEKTTENNLVIVREKYKEN